MSAPTSNELRLARLQLAARTLTEWKTPPSDRYYQGIVADLKKYHPLIRHAGISPKPEVLAIDERRDIPWYLADTVFDVPEVPSHWRAEPVAHAAHELSEALDALMRDLSEQQLDHRLDKLGLRGADLKAVLDRGLRGNDPELEKQCLTCLIVLLTDWDAESLAEAIRPLATHRDYLRSGRRREMTAWMAIWYPLKVIWWTVIGSATFVELSHLYEPQQGALMRWIAASRYEMEQHDLAHWIAVTAYVRQQEGLLSGIVISCLVVASALIALAAVGLIERTLEAIRAVADARRRSMRGAPWSNSLGPRMLKFIETGAYEERVFALAIKSNGGLWRTVLSVTGIARPEFVKVAIHMLRDPQVSRLRREYLFSWLSQVRLDVGPTG
jgi:hypothetical protein